ncbi:MAG TPA: hypothetical protein PKA06_11495, partial [Gemmatales bacterium]|nr:hypothetical protein [Gemmatales bacterium]
MMAIGKLSNRPAVQTIVDAKNISRTLDSSLFAIATSLTPAQQPGFATEPLLATQRLQDGVNGLRITHRSWWDALDLVLRTHLRAGHYYLW